MCLGIEQYQNTENTRVWRADVALPRVLYWLRVSHELLNRKAIPLCQNLHHGCLCLERDWFRTATLNHLPAHTRRPRWLHYWPTWQDLWVIIFIDSNWLLCIQLSHWSDSDRSWSDLIQYSGYANVNGRNFMLKVHWSILCGRRYWQWWVYCTPILCDSAPNRYWHS